MAICYLFITRGIVKTSTSTVGAAFLLVDKFPNSHSQVERTFDIAQPQNSHPMLSGCGRRQTKQQRIHHHHANVVTARTIRVPCEERNYYPRSPWLGSLYNLGLPSLTKGYPQRSPKTPTSARRRTRRVALHIILSPNRPPITRQFSLLSVFPPRPLHLPRA